MAFDWCLFQDLCVILAANKTWIVHTMRRMIDVLTPCQIKQTFGWYIWQNSSETQITLVHLTVHFSDTPSTLQPSHYDTEEPPNDILGLRLYHHFPNVNKYCNKTNLKDLATIREKSTSLLPFFIRVSDLCSLLFIVWHNKVLKNKYYLFNL